MEALDLAGIGYDRFREYLTRGYYRAAPRTTRGIWRPWGENDVVALVVFKRMMLDGLNPKEAGPIASELRILLEEHPTANRVLQVYSVFGFEHWQLAEGFDPDQAIWTEYGTVAPTVESWRVWNLERIRANVRSAIERAAQQRGSTGTDEAA